MSDKYRKIHLKAFVVDGHADTVLKLIEDHRNLSQHSANGAMNLPRLREGDVDLQVFAC